MTKEFEEILSWGGTPQAQCGCGRVHYASGGDFMEEGELAGLEAKHKAQPDRYIPTTDDSVGLTEVGGVTYVYDCPCRGLERVESLFWNNRARIIAYYKARTARELKEATDNAAGLAELPQSP
jgi:hypothetical protein